MINDQFFSAAAFHALVAVAGIDGLAQFVADARAFIRQCIEQGRCLAYAVEHGNHEPCCAPVVQVADQER
jgi:hypothetical protein